ncbi:hypothetical protein FRX31_020021, partial [Thalictrum thalictroides]
PVAAGADLAGKTSKQSAAGCQAEVGNGTLAEKKTLSEVESSGKQDAAGRQLCRAGKSSKRSAAGDLTVSGKGGVCSLNAEQIFQGFESTASRTAAGEGSPGVAAGYAMDYTAGSTMGSAARKEVLADKGVGVVAIDLLLIVETV